MPPLCKCRVCGRIYDYAHSGSYRYCSQNCVEREFEEKRYQEMLLEEKRRQTKMRRENMFNDMIRSGGQLGSKFKFRRARGKY